jgi:hypothetical protein
LVGIYSIADPVPAKTFQHSLEKHPGTYKTFEKIFSRKQVFQLRNYYINLNRQIQKFGEEPVLIDSSLTDKSRRNLEILFKNYGFLDNNTRYNIRPLSEIKAEVRYGIVEKKRFLIDSVDWNIASEYPRKLYRQVKTELQTRPGKFYNRNYLVKDREFLTRYFRDHGIYDFQSSYIFYDVIRNDSLPLLKLKARIANKIIQQADSIYEKPFLPHRYDSIQVVIASGRKNILTTHLREETYDSIRFIYTTTRFFRPRLLNEAILLKPGNLYSDKNLILTRKQLYFLDNFRQVYVSHYKENDTLLNGKILLVPLKRFGTNLTFNITHSSIRPIGIGGEFSFKWRNIFHGFENLQFSIMIQHAASKRFATGSSDRLFNVRETAWDLSLTIPRFLMPFFKKFVNLSMHPKTLYSLRYTDQTNIGLDRQKLHVLNSYEWKPSKPVHNLMSPLEINYVHYKNPERYFEIYTAAFNTLNHLAGEYYSMSLEPSQADEFIDFVLENAPPGSEIYQTVERIYERKVRLTENVLIINSNHTITYDTRKDIWDNDFYLFKLYMEAAGWLPGALSKITELPQNSIGQRMINKVPYAQYYKTEFTFIRHWDFGKKRILALQFFTGLAVPYGNSTNIPFVSAYFAGGSNDIRAWRAFELGPGATGGLGEFNEANFKILTGIEYRMPFYENHHLGFFVDAGNIWNVADDIPYREAKFKGWYSLMHEFAMGTGIGYRYDFGIFALRFDWAFKLHDPGRPEGQRWITDFSIRNSILQFGVNYPF